MLSLSGCAKEICKTSILTIQLPDVPVAGERVADELEKVCFETKCPNLTAYFNQIHAFKIKYVIYQQEIGKKN